MSTGDTIFNTTVRAMEAGIIRLTERLGWYERLQGDMNDADFADLVAETCERLEAAERERDRLRKIIDAYDSPGALGEVFALWAADKENDVARAEAAEHLIGRGEERADRAEQRMEELEKALRKVESMTFPGVARAPHFARAALREGGESGS